MSGVRGVNQLGAVARDARRADANLLKSTRRKLSKLGPIATKIVKASAAAKMPKRGGYAATLSGALKVNVKTDTGFTTAGVTLVYKAPGQAQLRDIPAINRGRLRKKVWGHTDRWVTQRVPAGFWDDAVDQTNDIATQYVRDVLDETVKILKG